MSRGINKVILVGNCGQDPEVRYMPSGGEVTNVSIATSESWKDKQTGEKRDRTEWHRVVFFNQLAKIAGDYLRKGSQIYVEGSLRTRKWQDQNGQDRYTTEIVANEMQMLSSRSSANSMDGDPGYSPEDAHMTTNKKTTDKPPTSSNDSSNNPKDGLEDAFDDYMPF